MKKFHFYVKNSEDQAFNNGNDIGIIVRQERISWRDSKSKHTPYRTKITLFVSQNKLVSIKQARLRGLIRLEPRQVYSPRAIIAAIKRCACTRLIGRQNPAPNIWFARAKVEQIK